MYSDLDKKYDVVITSTDLISSLLAAALGRVGKSVLHLDSLPRYGKEWRSMKLFDLLVWPSIHILEPKISVVKSIPELNESEQFLNVSRDQFITNIVSQFTVFDNDDECKTFIKSFSNKVPDDQFESMFDDFKQMFFCKFTQEPDKAMQYLDDLKEKWPQFNCLDNAFIVDLCPRMLFSNNQMVDTLIRSNVTRYLEFKKVYRILTPVQKESDSSSWSIVNVPCNRSDIFKSKIISMVEKRYLMKFLTFCYKLEQNQNELDNVKTKPFVNYLLEDQQMTAKLTNFIINSVLMDSGKISTDVAMNKISKFVRSIGRFSDRPCLCPMYGSEEILQSFCRYAAIHGVTYCLKTPINGIVIKDQKIKSIITEHFNVDCDFMITDYHIPDYKSTNFEEKFLSRAIICSSKSISDDNLSTEPENTSLLYLPTDFTGMDKPVYVFETDYSTRVCPKDLHIQYFWCDSVRDTAYDDLKHCIDKVYSSVNYFDQVANEPKLFETQILWSIYFNQKCTKIKHLDNMAPENLFTVTPPINELDYEYALNEARTIFQQMYPDDEFFPQTKQPEEHETTIEFE